MFQGVSAQIRSFGAASVERFAAFVFPPTCAGCNCSGTWLCDMCTERLVETGQGLDDVNRSAEFMSVDLIARYAFVEPVRTAVHLLKYDGQRARAEWFAEQLCPLLEQIRTANTILEPVPLTNKRERHRGFNQSREIANWLSASTGVPTGEHIERVRETRPQVELRGTERIANVRGAFWVESNLDHRDVVLVDDVITTGATMRECALACYEAGATTVVGLAAASALESPGR